MESRAAVWLAKFHIKFYGEHFGNGKQDTDLRISLHEEETKELVDEIRADNRVGILNELADVVIVAYGTAHSYGLPLDEAIDWIMAANMAKVDEHGRPVYREDGKLLKPPGWQPADLSQLMEQRRAG